VIEPLWFGVANAGVVGVVALLAAVFRNRFYAIFVTIMLGVESLIASGLYPHAGVLWPVFLYGHVAVVLHMAALVWPAMRPAPFRWLVSVVGHVFAGGTYLAFPFAIVAAFGVDVGYWWTIPYGIALWGLAEALWLRREEVPLFLDGEDAGELGRHPKALHVGGSPTGSEGRPLRIVQITDPHLGPWMSVSRLRGICERAVERDPDLVLLTGDFLTMESQSDHAHLRDALMPLKALEGRCFACHGNHDLEAPETVARALEAAGVTLLVDEWARVETAAGAVELVGFDFSYRQRAARMAAVLERMPARGDAWRIALLHDPGAFKHLADGAVDLVLSGHTHGGQLGLVSLGLPWTVVWSTIGMPDHGVFAKGRNRLYVHRGTGHYGFPLRLGVPAEESVLLVTR